MILDEHDLLRAIIEQAVREQREPRAVACEVLEQLRRNNLVVGHQRPVLVFPDDD